MIYPVPYEPSHLAQLRLQPAQAAAAADIPSVAWMLAGRHSSTAMLDGRPVMCGGCVPFSRERAMVWSFIGEEVRGPLFRAVHAYARRFIDALPYRRLEATTLVDFAAGHRWLRLLGFEQFDCGKDEALYALVRGA